MSLSLLGPAALGKAVKMFPDDRAKETFYIIDTRYSGQYHGGWKKMRG